MGKKATAKAKTAIAEEAEAVVKKAKKRFKLLKQSDATIAPKTEEPKTVLDQPIPKPTGGSSLDRFKAKRTMAAAGGPSPLESLSVLKSAQAKDWITLHPNEECYWSEPMCFVDVPVKGQKKGTLHLIDEDLAIRYLPRKRIQRFRLALASKPFDVFFLCSVPCVNLDNKYNEMALKGCIEAKGKWLKIVSRQEEGHDDYAVAYPVSQEAFPTPRWPT